MEAIKDASHLYEVEHRARFAERPGFRIQELQLSPTQKVPWHYHNNVSDTFYVLKGYLRIFVQDTPPNLSDARRCVDGKGQPIANLTNALRFDFDVNSDDETEDQNAQTREGWDFRYGRTTYGWVFTEPWYDIGDHDQLLEADNRLRAAAGLPTRDAYDPS